VYNVAFDDNAEKEFLKLEISYLVPYPLIWNA